jgi:hypothetical protein
MTLLNLGIRLVLSGLSRYPTSSKKRLVKGLINLHTSSYDGEKVVKVIFRAYKELIGL